MRLRSTAAGQGSYAADTTALVADSQWEATVLVTDAAGNVTGSRSFDFGLDREGISSGRLAPAIDPVLAIGLIVGLAGFAGFGWALSGRSIPRTPADWGRRVLLAGSGAGAALGLLIVVGGSVR